MTRRAWRWTVAVLLLGVGGTLLVLRTPTAPPEVVWMPSPGDRFRWDPESRFTLAPRGESLGAEYFVVSMRTPPGTLVLAVQEPVWRRLLARCGLPSPEPVECWRYDCDLDTTVKLEEESWYRFVRRRESSPGS